MIHYACSGPITSLLIRLTLATPALLLTQNLCAKTVVVGTMTIVGMDACPSKVAVWSDSFAKCLHPNSVINLERYVATNVRVSVSYRQTILINGSKSEEFDLIANNCQAGDGQYETPDKADKPFRPDKPGKMTSILGVIGGVATAYNRTQGISTSPIYQPPPQERPQSRTQAPVYTSVRGAGPSQQSAAPGTLKNVPLNQTLTNQPVKPTIPQQPVTSAPLSLGIQDLNTSAPVNTGAGCQLPCPQGLFCTGNGVQSTTWQQTTSYTVTASSNASVAVTINMNDGSQQKIPMYVVKGASSHQFTTDTGCSVYAPRAINATQGFISND